MADCPLWRSLLATIAPLEPNKIQRTVSRRCPAPATRRSHRRHVGEELDVAIFSLFVQPDVNPEESQKGIRLRTVTKPGDLTQFGFVRGVGFDFYPVCHKLDFRVFFDGLLRAAKANEFAQIL